MKKILLLLMTIFIFACGAKEKIQDAINSVDPERKPINKAMTGVNAFANDGRFGSMSAQFGEVRDTLGLRFVRVLFVWNDDVQPSPTATPNFSFDDAVIDSIPSGVDVLAVTSGIPSWMHNSANWIGSDPKATYVERWIKPLARHIASKSKLTAIEVWNEPNMDTADNAVMGFSDPVAYVSMLSQASSAIRSIVPGKRVLNAATTAINQNFPDTLDYNKSMIESGVLNSVDVFAVHYYGEQFERVIMNNGVADFLNSVGKPIWITESGAQGINNQLRYVERTWPFLLDKIPAIQRFYYYQFTEATPADVTYGLKNLSGNSVSDLYVYLRDH